MSERAPNQQSKTCTIIDGMEAIQSLANVSAARIFGEWRDKFSAYVTSHFSDKCTRVDVVFDRYVPNSIKGGKESSAKEGRAGRSGEMWKAGIRALATGRDSLS